MTICVLLCCFTFRRIVSSCFRVFYMSQPHAYDLEYKMNEARPLGDGNSLRRSKRSKQHIEVSPVESTELLTHQQLEQQKIDLTCPLCSKRYSRHDNLIAHQRSVHGPNKVVCTTCNTHFSSDQALLKHVVVHTDDRPYSCEICSKDFKRADSLKQHEETHFIVDLRCEEDSCGLSFDNHLALRRHKRSHTDAPYVTSGLEIKCRPYHEKASLSSFQIITVKSKDQHQCTHCLQTFATCGSFRTHWNTHHCEVVEVESNRTFIDNGVRKHLTDREYHNKHEHRRIGERCDVCFKLFGTKQDMLRHKMIHHTSDNTDAKDVKFGPKCEHCLKNCRYGEERHQLVFSKGKTYHQCIVDRCLKRYLRCYQSSNHQRDHHSQTDVPMIKGYQCDKCFVLLSCRKTLDKHKLLSCPLITPTTT